MNCDWCNKEYDGGGYWVGKENICSEECLLERTKQRDPDPLPRKEVISIQPGDVIVLNLKTDTDMDVQKQLYDDLKRFMLNAEVVILSGGATLEVYREQEKV